MRKLLVIILFCMFIIRKDDIVLAVLNGWDLWNNKLFPLLFPTFVLSDLLISTGIVNFIVKRFGFIYEKLFKNNKIGLYILLISFIAGTPNNAKNLKFFKDSNLLNDSEINKILISSILFNPLLIISLGGFKLLLILFLSNFIVGLLFRNVNVLVSNREFDTNYSFELSESISKNISVCFQILGTVVIFSSLISLLKTNNLFFNLFINIFLELSNGINFISMFYNNSLCLYAVVFSFGGISILMQIKSILKDTFINYKLIILSRLVCTCISVCLCSFT